MGAILEKFLKWRVSLLLSALLTLCSISPLKAQAIGVEIDSLRSYLTFLAGERLQGRFPGTPHDSIAAHYIAEKMAQSGLVPLFGNSYLLPFNFIIERKILESSLKFDSITLKKGRDYSFSPLSPTTSFKGELLSVAEVVKGRNPLLLLNIAHDSLKYIVTKEMERGYRAILNLDPSGKVIVEEGIKGSPFPIPVISISSSLYSQFLNSPNGEVEVEVKTAPIEITTYNVAGRRVPTEGELSILVGAHYDHLGVKESAHSTTVEREIFYGADDNASGVAALLELIRVSQQKSRNQPSLSTGWNPIFVAFGAEEQGVIGSTHLADTLDALGALPKIMLNLDMVGRLRKEALFVEGVGTFKEAEALLDKANSSCQLNIKGMSIGSGGSDHTSFNVKRVPLLSLSTGAHPQYHSPADSVGSINFVGLERVTNFALQLIDAIDSLDIEPQFIEQKSGSMSPQHNPKGEGKRVTLGLIPDFTYEVGDGFRIGSVIQGKSAHDGGLQEGDIIVKIGERTINNIYDYMGIMAHLKSGESVVIHFIREGERLISTVVPQ